MKPKYAVFQGIECEDPITEASYFDFLELLKKAILLELKEQGALSYIQYQKSIECLDKQKNAEKRS